MFSPEVQLFVDYLFYFFMSSLNARRASILPVFYSHCHFKRHRFVLITCFLWHQVYSSEFLVTRNRNQIWLMMWKSFVLCFVLFLEIGSSRNHHESWKPTVRKWANGSRQPAGCTPAVLCLEPRALCQQAWCCLSSTAKIRPSILPLQEHSANQVGHEGPEDRDGEDPSWGIEGKESSSWNGGRGDLDAGLCRR